MGYGYVMAVQKVSSLMSNYLSATKLNMLFKCAYQFYLRYVKEIKKAPGISLLVGRSVDKSSEDDLQNVIDNGSLLETEQVQDIARDVLNQECDKEGARLTKEELQEGEKKIRGQCVDKSVRLAKLHHNKVAPIIKPKQLQRKWEIDIDGFPYGLMGYIDIMEENNIRDTKTTGSKKTGAADKSLQLTIYALAGKILDKKDYKLFLDFLVDNKTPKEDIQETFRTQRDFEVLFKKLEIAAKILESGIFPPTNPETSYVCSPAYCGFWARDCPYV
jgi:hypothetical protein